VNCTCTAFDFWSDGCPLAFKGAEHDETRKGTAALFCVFVTPSIATARVFARLRPQRQACLSDTPDMAQTDFFSKFDSQLWA
jgi:hypothetical protein